MGFLIKFFLEEDMTSQFQLVMRTGPVPGTVYPLEGEQLTIGRDPSNPIHITDAEVSRRHARLMLQGGRYVLEDLGSTNGTFVNGRRISAPYVLKPGDVISLGESISLVFEAVTFDPGATVVSPSAKATVAAPPPAAAVPLARPAAPAPAPYPAPTPVPPMAPPAAPTERKFPLPILIAVLAFLLLLCACGGFLWWVDATYRWCTFFPFLFPGACP
jgi:hypothetical protein